MRFLNLKVYVIIAGVALFFQPFSNVSAEMKDTESASHADTAAYYELVNTYSYPGFKILQFNLSVLSHYSYMVISNGEALVVDPGRDIYKYLETAKQENISIKGVLLSHSHADFIAGHMEMAKATGCPIYISEKADAGYSHVSLKEGSIIELGKATLKVLETPGHTLDCTTSLVFSEEDKNVPKALFSGDTLFAGSIGRPDLMGGTISAAALASLAYDTWTQKLSKLKDSVVVFPAHGAGSLCGAHLSSEPYSTIGKERKTNVYLQHTSRSDFIAAILEGLPDAPQYFKYNAALNKKGPELIDWMAPLPEEKKPEMQLTDPALFYVVDLRDPKEYAKAHIPNSINIALRGRLETWTGIMVPWEAKLVLTGNEEELKEAIYRLHRVGYSAEIVRFDSWKNSDRTVRTITLMEPKDLYALMQKGTAPVIVDVRLPSEWMGLRIGQVINMPLNELETLSSKLDVTQPVIAVCNSAYRSSMAMGVLERKGFINVSSMNGGSEAWINAGLPVFGSETKTPETKITAPKREIKLPGTISSSELKNLMMDLPGTFDLVDIRPPAQFEDFSLPGSSNVDINDLISNQAYLNGTGPLIIMDRDGSLAMMIAGMLFNKSPRMIKALRGGLEAYWQESDFIANTQSGSDSSLAGPEGMPAEKTSKPDTQAKNPPADKPQTPKTKSAGC